MQDTYMPQPLDVARCPRCYHTIRGMVSDYRHVGFVALGELVCPVCGQSWSELRTAQATQRYWSPPAAQPSTPE